MPVIPGRSDPFRSAGGAPPGSRVHRLLPPRRNRAARGGRSTGRGSWSRASWPAVPTRECLHEAALRWTGADTVDRDGGCSRGGTRPRSEEPAVAVFRPGYVPDWQLHRTRDGPSGLSFDAPPPPTPKTCSGYLASFDGTQLDVTVRGPQGMTGAAGPY